MINEQFQQPQIDLKDTRDIPCECGNLLFMLGYRFRKASKLLTGGDRDTVMPFEVPLCTNCGKPLDEFLPEWRMELNKKAMEFAEKIVERAKKRVKNGLDLLPRNICNKKNRTTLELEQEHKDAAKLNNFKESARILVSIIVILTVLVLIKNLRLSKIVKK